VEHAWRKEKMERKQRNMLTRILVLTAFLVDSDNFPFHRIVFEFTKNFLDRAAAQVAVQNPAKPMVRNSQVHYTCRDFL
jgi:hypothetical protein